MKTYMLLVLAVILAVSLASDSCNTNSDCAADECCYQKNDFIPKLNCKKLGQEGDQCPRHNRPLKKYRYYCPCSPGLVCAPTKVKTDEGTFEVYKCIKE